MNPSSMVQVGSSAVVTVQQSNIRSYISDRFSINSASLEAERPAFEMIQLANNCDANLYLCSTHWKSSDGPEYETVLPEDEVGRFAGFSSKIPAISDQELLDRFRQANENGLVPAFYRAAPRSHLFFNLRSGSTLTIGILTAGGLAPGLNTVIHQILARHELYARYAFECGDGAAKLQMMGFPNGFNGLIENKPRYMFSDSSLFRGAESFLARGHYGQKEILFSEDLKNAGGSILGIERGKDLDKLPNACKVIKEHGIDILYCIGGNGTITGAYKLKQCLRHANLSTTVCVIPKTIDNDILWVESFGLKTAIDKAVKEIELLRTEAASTHRVAVIGLMGRDSGSLAANASLASGLCDLCLVPEVHRKIDLGTIAAFLKERMASRVSGTTGPYAVVLVAEGCADSEWIDSESCSNLGPSSASNARKRNSAAVRLASGLKSFGIDAIVHEPGYGVRSTHPNPSDRILCSRLASLAVDSALAGFDEFVVASRGDSHALIPLLLTADKSVGGLGGPKKLNPSGKFWAEVSSRNQQIKIDKVCQVGSLVAVDL